MAKTSTSFCFECGAVVEHENDALCEVCEAVTIDDPDSVEQEEPLTPEGWDADWHMMQPRG